MCPVSAKTIISLTSQDITRTTPPQKKKMGDREKVQNKTNLAPCCICITRTEDARLVNLQGH